MKTNNSIKTVFSLVTYKAPKYFSDCLKSLDWTSKDETIQLIVVDNSPDDEIKSVVDNSDLNIIYERSETNLGYGKGHNRVFQISEEFYKPDQILIMNTDLTLEEDDFNNLLAVLHEHKFNRIVGPKLVTMNGTVEESILTDPSSRAYFINFAKQLFNKNTDKRVGLRSSEVREEVKGLSGACLLIDRNAIQGEFIFDPDYQMYFEDLDLCRRVRRDGGKIVYVPEVVVEHALGASSEEFENREQWQREMTYLSLSTYFKKNKGSFDTAFLMFTLNTALRIRILLGKDKEWARDILNRIND